MMQLFESSDHTWLTVAKRNGSFVSIINAELWGLAPACWAAGVLTLPIPRVKITVWQASVGDLMARKTGQRSKPSVRGV
jgi:hypothetical protein